MALLAGAWSYFTALTGGFNIELGGARISSRGARNPAVATVVLGALAWMLAPAGSRWRTLHSRIVSLLDRPVRVCIDHAGIVAALLAVLIGVLATPALITIAIMS